MTFIGPQLPQAAHSAESLHLGLNNGTSKLDQDSRNSTKAAARVGEPSTSGIQLEWKHPRRAGAGLRNLGNTCYLNSILQCLTHNPLIANLALKKQHSQTCVLKGCTFCLLENHILRCLRSSGDVHSPSHLYSHLLTFVPHFGYGQQEDAHELLRYAIEALHQSCMKAIGRTKDGPAALSPETGVYCETPTVVESIFGGVTQSQVKCLLCGGESNTFEPTMDLSLEVHQASSVEGALAALTAPEKLDGDNKYRCDNCKRLAPAVKRTTLHRAPNILAIHLKRFESIYGSKIQRHIGFGEHLDLRKHTSESGGDGAGGGGGCEEGLRYSLFAVLVHSGATAHSGHYFCFAKDSYGWNCFDDSTVHSTSLHTVKQQCAYMLFYVRTSPAPPLDWSRSQKSPAHPPSPTPEADYAQTPGFIGPQPPPSSSTSNSHAHAASLLSPTTVGSNHGSAPSTRRWSLDLNTDTSPGVARPLSSKESNRPSTGPVEEPARGTRRQNGGATVSDANEDGKVENGGWSGWRKEPTNGISVVGGNTTSTRRLRGTTHGGDECEREASDTRISGGDRSERRSSRDARRSAEKERGADEKRPRHSGRGGGEGTEERNGPGSCPSRVGTDRPSTSRSSEESEGAEAVGPKRKRSPRLREKEVRERAQDLKESGEKQPHKDATSEKGGGKDAAEVTEPFWKTIYKCTEDLLRDLGVNSTTSSTTLSKRLEEMMHRCRNDSFRVEICQVVKSALERLRPPWMSVVRESIREKKRQKCSFSEVVDKHTRQEITRDARSREQPFSQSDLKHLWRMIESVSEGPHA